MNNEKYIIVDPSDLNGMRKLMEKHGDSETMFLGESENGENVTISIFKDRIITVTEQANGWYRRNIRYDDGRSEELFEGKWRE